MTTLPALQDIRPRLSAFVRRRVREPSDAEDIVQTVLLKALASAGGLRAAGSVEAWLYRIARNAIIDHYRRRPPVPLDGQPEPAAPPEEPDRRAVEELADCAAAMMQGLPAAYRDALDLVDRRGLTQAEAAARLGLSLSGTKSRVQRGRVLLRRTLEGCCRVSLDAGGRPSDFAGDRADGGCAAGTASSPPSA